MVYLTPGNNQNTPRLSGAKGMLRGTTLLATNNRKYSAEESRLGSLYRAKPATSYPIVLIDLLSPVVSAK